jgi:ribose transport system permease protein
MLAASAPAVRRGSRRRPRLIWQRCYAAGVLAVVLLVLDIVFSGGTFSSIQALGITNDALPLALAAAGETFVVLTNGIDLSVGSIITIANVVVASSAQRGLANEGVLLAVVLGGMAGLANGLIVSYARIAPLIATLATSSIFVGVALLVLPLPGGTVPGWLPGWTSGSLGSVPVSVVWLAVLLVAGWLVLRRTQFGVNLQALGGSEQSSWSAGIKVVRVRTLAYVVSGVCSGLSGIALAGLTQSGDPTIGAPYLLNTIAAVVIGGTSLAGGVGTVAGSVLGAVVLSLVSAVLLVSGLSTYLQYVVSGAIVIGALVAQAQLWRRQATGLLAGPRRWETPPAQPAGAPGAPGGGEG